MAHMVVISAAKKKFRGFQKRRDQKKLPLYARQRVRWSPKAKRDRKESSAIDERKGTPSCLSESWSELSAEVSSDYAFSEFDLRTESSAESKGEDNLWKLSAMPTTSRILSG